MTSSKSNAPAHKAPIDAEADQGQNPVEKPKKAREINGPKGLEPTRYGDWERKGLVSDF